MPQAARKSQWNSGTTGVRLADWLKIVGSLGGCAITGLCLMRRREVYLFLSTQGPYGGGKGGDGGRRSPVGPSGEPILHAGN